MFQTKDETPVGTVSPTKLRTQRPLKETCYEPGIFLHVLLLLYHRAFGNFVQQMLSSLAGGICEASSQGKDEDVRRHVDMSFKGKRAQQVKAVGPSFPQYNLAYNLVYE